MKIGIFADSLGLDFQNGTKRYTEELLMAISIVDKKNDYVIFTTKKVKLPQSSNFKLVVIPEKYLFKRQLLLPIFVKKENVSILHNLDPYSSIFLKHRAMVTTVHDMDLKTVYGGNKNAKLLLSMLYAIISRYFVLRNSAGIISVSKFTYKELKTKYKNLIKNKEFRIIPEAPSKIFRPTKIKRVNRRYILCMADFSLRKNIETAFLAYGRLPNKTKKEHPLYIVVSTKDKLSHFRSLLKKHDILKYSRIFVSPPDRTILGLYQNALCFLYTSLYEGFGLPILEAMSCGCPVITSNFGAMKETAGGASLLVNPRSADAISEAILKLLNDRTFRERLMVKGYLRVKDFNWRQSALKTIKLYSLLNKLQSTPD